MINRVILVGRLTKDPELRYTPNGLPVGSFTIAVNRTFTNLQGEREADFINCIVWRKTAENVANFLKKGSLIGVDGRIQTRSYEAKDGRRVFVTEVVADSVQFLESKNAKSSQNSAQDHFSRNNNSANNYPDPFLDNGQPIDISFDDLPF